MHIYIHAYIHIHSKGPDEILVKSKITEEGLAWTFKGAIDHANPETHEYKVIVLA
jgi:hypothetical protein